MKYFDVYRSDNCVWLIDKRDKGQQVHFTPDQAQEVGKALLNISSKGLDHDVQDGKTKII